MLLAFLFLTVVAFLEVGFFLFLRKQAARLASRQVAVYRMQENSERDFQEAEVTLQNARKLYNDASRAHLAR